MVILLIKTFVHFKYQKCVNFNLQNIYGIGLIRAYLIIKCWLGRSGVPFWIVRKAHLQQIDNFHSYFKWLFAKVLLITKAKNVAKYKRIGCYRGLRLAAFLPSHGQRTRSNAISARFVGSGSFEYIPKQPNTNLKKLSSYVNRTDIIKKKSALAYQKRLKINFILYRDKDEKRFAMAVKKGELGNFRQFVPYAKKIKRLKK